MKKQQERFYQMLPVVIFVMICFWTVSTWVFARFVHYHAQYRVLKPADYTAKVEPVATASRVIGESGDYQKSEDEKFYVRVKTLGTAHHVERTTTDLLPIFVFSLGGVV
jgi:uncharacterized ion transporter superfamily protein YfcC